ncbi:unnamed protein product [Meganyctiphanes norvegica]|uniref:SET domain-containing protein n=1 Tax=Meganyctiphanes norvegica TaxID=48144 RepID=A0AAV2QHH3_MEGNR
MTDKEKENNTKMEDNEENEDEEEQDERVERLLEYMESLTPYNPQWAGPGDKDLQQAMGDVSLVENDTSEKNDGADNKRKTSIEIEPNIVPGCPVGITMTPGAGRQMIALRDIEAGEVLIREPYLLITPKLGAPPCCLDCLRLLGAKPTEVCEACGAPRCSPVCDGKGHSDMECKILSRIGLKKFWAEGKEAGNLLKQVNAIMTPLRTLMLVMDNEEMGSLVSTLESNVARRDIIKDSWDTERKLSSALKILGVNVEEMMVLKICGIFDTNAFEVIGHKETEGKARVIFPAIAMMNHSCISNTSHHYREDKMFVRASQNISKGDAVTCSYTHMLWGSRQRRKHLLLTKLFLCMCSRCVDPSEMGTHVSSIMCPKCSDGLLVPPENAKEAWTCSSCNGKTEAKIADTVVALAEKNCGKFAEATDYNSDIPALKDRLELISSGLGYQHYLCLELRRLIVNAYMKGKEQELKLSDSELWEVVDFSANLIKFADKAEPGYSSFRGDLYLSHLRAATTLLYRYDKKYPIDENKKESQESDEQQKLSSQLAGNSVAENITNSNSTGDESTPKKIAECHLDTKVLSAMGADALRILKYDPVLPEATKNIYVLYKIYTKRGHFVLSR